MSEDVEPAASYGNGRGPGVERGAVLRAVIRGHAANAGPAAQACLAALLLATGAACAQQGVAEGLPGADAPAVITLAPAAEPGERLVIRGRVEGDSFEAGVRHGFRQGGS
jgi:hypothetical protein